MSNEKRYRRQRPDAVGFGADAKWLAALGDDDEPEAWEAGVAVTSTAAMATDVAELAARVAALEDCLVFEVAAGQTAQRHLAEMRARLDVLEGASPAPEVPNRVENERVSHPSSLRGSVVEPVVDGLRSSVRAAGRLLEGRRAGPR
ncbi:MAG: hypothetical protein ABIW46_00180 [Acidimicrobiales bacterium]